MRRLIPCLATSLAAGFAAPAIAESELEQVVITAAGFEQRIAEAPASITVLSAEKLQQQRSASIAEALADVEGIDTGGTRGKTGGLNVSMRGMPSDYTLILIDGRRQNTAGSVTPNGFGETSTSFLPPMTAIERIEVVRGPMSTLYGSDAMGGVVNIITRKVSDVWGVSLTSDATVQENTDFGNMYSAGLYVDGPLVANRLGLALRGSYYHRAESDLDPTGEFDDGTSISKRGASPVEGDVYSFGGRLMYTPNESNDISFDADIARQSYDNTLGQLGTLDRPNATPPTYNGYSPELEFNREQYTLAHTLRFADAVLDSSLMRNTTETIGRTLPVGTPGKAPGGPRTLENENVVLDTKLTLPFAAHKLTVGGQYWDAQMIDGVALQPFEHKQWSLFAEDEWRIVDRLALTAGARLDDHDVFGDHVSPRAYLVWNATDAFTIKGGVSRGFKTPRLEQLQAGIVGFTGQGRTAVIGTPTLQPETSTSSEIGFYFTGPRGLRVGATLFNNEFEDKITSGTPVPNCTWAVSPNRPGCLNYGSFPSQESFSQTVNVDEAVTRGGEFSLSMPFAAVWTTALNYTYTDSEQKSGDDIGQPLTNTPRHMVNASLRWQATDRFDAWVRSEYRSDRFRNPGPARDALGDYKAYAVLHLGGGFQLNERVRVNATVYNLFDEDFLEYGAYEDGGTQYTSLYNNHQEGRRLWVSAQFTF